MLVLRGEAGVGSAVRVKVTDRVHQIHPLNAALLSVETINIPYNTLSKPPSLFLYSSLLLSQVGAAARGLLVSSILQGPLIALGTMTLNISLHSSVLFIK